MKFLSIGSAGAGGHCKNGAYRSDGNRATIPPSRGGRAGPVRLAVWIWILAAPLMVSCNGETDPATTVSRAEPYLPLDTGTVRITTTSGTHHLSVEIADTPEERAFGLMERDTLPEDEGMLFVYKENNSGPFYMYHTRIPLSIAFFDEEGQIVSILEMAPCVYPVPDLCERYDPGVEYIGAVEATEGFFGRRGVQVGDRIELLGALSPAPATP